ncbi:MAG TPA: DNA adenine methylase [Acidimicrobiales bacterium]|nr:DNA adenine methylase [Acidimicrobiales bacterium]
MIKYLGSKRRLVPALTEMARASGAATALDLFTGTTRVAQALKRLGIHTTAVDSSRAAHVLARCYVATDPEQSPTFLTEVAEAVDDLNGRDGRPGYVTDTFCRSARFFRPENGARIDAIRDAIDADYAETPLWPVLMTSLLEAADRVDSTTGVQMAYLKQWASRADRPLALRIPGLIPGAGRAVRGDACGLVADGPDRLPAVDLAYLDPPYNQHRYESNYHVWETLVEWDAPVHYGIACKREDLRLPTGRSPFNRRLTMPAALAEVIAAVRADTVVLSYNDESWLTLDELHDMCAARGHVEVVSFDSARYVGARIGIHNPAGHKVGSVSHLRNTEYVLIAGTRDRARRMARSVTDPGLGVAVDRPPRDGTRAGAVPV